MNSLGFYLNMGLILVKSVVLIHTLKAVCVGKTKMVTGEELNLFCCLLLWLLNIQPGGSNNSFSIFGQSSIPLLEKAHIYFVIIAKSE